MSHTSRRRRERESHQPSASRLLAASTVPRTSSTTSGVVDSSGIRRAVSRVTRDRRFAMLSGRLRWTRADARLGRKPAVPGDSPRTSPSPWQSSSPSALDTGCRSSSQAIALSHTLRALACLPKAAVRDTQRTMPDESTTPDLTELVRHLLDAVSRVDGEAFVRFFGSRRGLILTGCGAIEGRGRDSRLP